MISPRRNARAVKPRLAVVIAVASCFTGSSMGSRAWASPDAVGIPPAEGDEALPASVPPTATPTATPTPTPTPVAIADRRTPKAVFVAGGAALAAAVVGTLFGVRALHEKSRFDDGDNTSTRAEAVEKNALLADMAFGATLAFGLTAAMLWLDREDGLTAERERRASPQPLAFPTPRLIPSITPSSAGAAAIFHF